MSEIKDIKDLSKRTENRQNVITYLDEKLGHLFNGVISINKKVDFLVSNVQSKNNSNIQVKNDLNDFMKMGIPSNINLLPKQMYLAYKKGWTLQMLSTLSGYSVDEVVKKISAYAKSNT